MSNYLLAVDADKIQDLIFRASHLREVTGGSNLLSRFCQDMPGLLGLDEEQIVTNGGGAFRLIFSDETEATQMGNELADIYYQATGCTLTVSSPVRYETDTDFPEANIEATKRLNMAKQSQKSVATPHHPYLALCSSTGVEIASAFATVKPRQRANYVSAPSLHKNAERQDGREEFLIDFYDRIITFAKEQAENDQAENEQEADAYDFSPPVDAGELGSAGGYDTRNYVGYLAADGNGMGEIFRTIKDRDKVKQLSTALSDIVNNSLAKAIYALWHEAPHRKSWIAPALPLILGGDDIFVLLPATYALEIARRFCHNYEEEMNAFLNILNNGQPLTNKQGQPIIATMGAAVIICKATYPFQLAHRRGEELLGQAKKVSKAQPQHCSTINFEIIIGNRLVDPVRRGEYQPTLRPYGIASTIAPPRPQLCTIEALQQTRIDLDNVPQKRRAYLRQLFGKAQQMSNRHEFLTAELGKFLKRTATVRSGGTEMAGALEKALQSLGSEQAGYYWRDMTMVGAKFSGNALPDVLDAWTFLAKLPDPPEHNPNPTQSNGEGAA